MTNFDCGEEPETYAGVMLNATKLLNRAATWFSEMESAPDPQWWRDYFLFTGDHMILTEEGWQPGECKKELVAEFGEDYIEDEVNKPDETSNQAK